MLLEKISCLIVTCSTEGLVTDITVLATYRGLAVLLAGKASSLFCLILTILVSFFFEWNTMVLLPILINQGIQGFRMFDWIGSKHGNARGGVYSVGLLKRSEECKFIGTIGDSIAFA
jgi:hypothetical protein